MDTENVPQSSIKLLEYKPDEAAQADEKQNVGDCDVVSLVDLARQIRELERKIDVLVDNSVNAALLAKRQVRGALA